MCGIAGILPKNKAVPDQGLLRGLARTIAHRGSDGEGVWAAPGVGLVHRRLAIIDLSPTGQQPMHDRTGRLTIVFNGEIYNYRELRAELESRGVTWMSASDTECILEGYRVWGDDVVLKLRGMFAFALWDADRQRLLMARDRIGKKPLFYSVLPDGSLAFASELKALLPLVERKPDLSALRLFVGLQYVPSPRTGFEGVAQLEIGSRAVWEDGALTVSRYHEWSLPEEQHGTAPAETDERIRALLDEAVKIRQLAADVPVGAFLSGGVDSAAVVAFATRHAPQPLQTFTMGFSTPSMDEREPARRIAKHFQTKHHEFEARPADLLTLLDTLVGHYDAPYADASALPLWLLARETAKDIKVVLTGDGGDEAFGGYRRYMAYERARFIADFPGASFSGLALHAMGVGLHDPRFQRMGDVVALAGEDPARAYAENFTGSYFSSSRLMDLLRPEFAEATSGSDAVRYITDALHSAPYAKGNPLRRAMFFDLTSYLPDDLNVKMDRATMAFGLEARSPFLDQELLAFALSLPSREKVSIRHTKIALKRALRPVLPEWVIDRPKRGFEVPLGEWFRGPLRTLIEERCLSEESPLRAVCRRDAIEKLLRENDRGFNHGNRLWMLLTLATWLDMNARP